MGFDIVILTSAVISMKAAESSTQMNRSVYVPIKLYLQKMDRGWIWPEGYSFPTHILKQRQQRGLQ